VTNSERRNLSPARLRLRLRKRRNRLVGRVGSCQAMDFWRRVRVSGSRRDLPRTCALSAFENNERATSILAASRCLVTPINDKLTPLQWPSAAGS